jgi:hypothetical protein
LPLAKTPALPENVAHAAGIGSALPRSRILRGFAVFLSLICSSMAAHAETVSIADILASAEGTGQVYVGPRKAIVKEGFAFQSSAPVKIILFRPDVRVTEQSTAGLDQPKADWTETARLQLTSAMQSDSVRRGLEMRMMAELDGDDSRLMADYKKLFKTVADAAIRHRLFAASPLPTKAESFDWSLGPGVARLGQLGGGDFGLFVYANDSYVSQGRKNARLISRLMGAPDDSVDAETRVGYAGLVDLKTGALVWLNVDVNGRGDIRSASGAAVRVSGLLQGFPAPVQTLANVRAK